MLLCKEHHLDLWPRDDSEYVNKKIIESCLGYTVSGVSVNFGGDDVLPTIDVLLE